MSNLCLMSWCLSIVPTLWFHHYFLSFSRNNNEFRLSYNTIIVSIYANVCAFLVFQIESLPHFKMYLVLIDLFAGCLPFVCLGCSVRVPKFKFVLNYFCHPNKCIALFRSVEMYLTQLQTPFSGVKTLSGIKLLQPPAKESPTSVKRRCRKNLNYSSLSAIFKWRSPNLKINLSKKNITQNIDDNDNSDDNDGNGNNASDEDEDRGKNLAYIYTKLLF